MMSKRIPTHIHRSDEGLTLTWDDATQVMYPAKDLRIACQCAECRDEMSGHLLLDPASVSDAIRPDSVELVGGYGLRVHWSDGHHTGIYTYDHLVKMIGDADA